MGVQLSSRIQGLEKSFKTFNQLSESLETTYQFFEDRVAHLQFQIKELQQKRDESVEDRDYLSRDLTNILQAIPAGVVVLDPAGRIRHCNPAATDLLGGPLKGEVWRDIVARDFAPRSDDGHEVSLRDGRRVSIATCPIGDDPGQVMLLTDVSETRRLQAQLSQQQRLTAMGEMTAGLAHQIRTPVSSVLLSMSQLKNNKLDETSHTKIVDKIIAQMRSLEGLVNDMLLFSRTGFAGEELIDIDLLLEAVKSETKQQISESDAVLHIKSGENKSNAIGNSAILQSAIQNLISNSLQACPEGVEINIEVVAPENNRIDILVSDTGPGIPVEIREKIFDPFFTTREKGTGLGLSIVRAIIRAHNGEVWLDETSTKGCVFIISLPCKQNSHTKRKLQ